MAGGACLCGARRQADRRMKPYLEQRLRQMANDPQSTWEDPDLARLARLARLTA